MAEHPAVNRVVVGSSPTWGAQSRSHQRSVFSLQSTNICVMMGTHQSLGGRISVQRVSWIVYLMYSACALLLLFAGWLVSKPPSEPARFVSTHHSSPMAPMKGFSEESLVNSADARTLDRLPGVGEVIAQRIIETRAYLNGFRLPEDLLLVKGIGEKTLIKIMEALQEPLVSLEELEE